MNQTILWLFLLQPILDNEAREPREQPIKECTDTHQRNIKGLQRAVYKVCA